MAIPFSAEITLNRVENGEYDVDGRELQVWGTTCKTGVLRRPLTEVELEEYQKNPKSLELIAKRVLRKEVLQGHSSFNDPLPPFDPRTIV